MVWTTPSFAEFMYAVYELCERRYLFVIAHDRHHGHFRSPKQYGVGWTSRSLRSKTRRTGHRAKVAPNVLMTGRVFGKSSGTKFRSWLDAQRRPKRRSDCDNTVAHYGQPFVGVRLIGASESRGPNWSLNMTRLRPPRLRLDGYKMDEKPPCFFEIQYPIACSLVGAGGG